VACSKDLHLRSKAEHANVVVLKGLKTKSFKNKLKASSKGWLDALPFRTTVDPHYKDQAYR
jgi:hypothetical protein